MVEVASFSRWMTRHRAEATGSAMIRRRRQRQHARDHQGTHASRTTNLPQTVAVTGTASGRRMQRSIQEGTPTISCGCQKADLMRQHAQTNMDGLRKRHLNRHGGVRNHGGDCIIHCRRRRRITAQRLLVLQLSDGSDRGNMLGIIRARMRHVRPTCRRL